jgi:hypothetical protein
MKQEVSMQLVTEGATRFRLPSSRSEIALRRVASVAGVVALACVASACVDSSRPRAVIISPEPALVAGSVKRIADDGAGGLILPDGSRVEVDAQGGFTLPNGDYVRRDRSGALNLPNGSRCLPDGRGGFGCP